MRTSNGFASVSTSCSRSSVDRRSVCFVDLATKLAWILWLGRRMDWTGVLGSGRVSRSMTSNGTGKEYHIQLSPQMALKVSDLTNSIAMTEELMNKIIEQYKLLCDHQQVKMDILIGMLCESIGHKVPQPYEYKLDTEELVLTIREKERLPSQPAILDHP